MAGCPLPTQLPHLKADKTTFMFTISISVQVNTFIPSQAAVSTLLLVF
jgi:hypothetical protein